MNLWINNKPLSKVKKITYLGKFITNDNREFLSEKSNVSRDKKVWNMLRGIVTCNKVNPKVMKYIYCEIILPILSYGSDTWDITPKIAHLVEVFHHKLEHAINRKKFLKAWKTRYGERIVNWNKNKR